MADVPKDIEKLLAVAPEDFVEERKRLARKLRDEGRSDDARAAAETAKPSVVVLAVNRAARDRPQAAKDAARAAERLSRAQLSGKPDEYRELLGEMEQASALLAEVAVANLSRGKTATEAMRRRVADHIRGVLANEALRRLLVRGALRDEAEAPGFDAFAGLPRPKRSRQRATAKPPRDEERQRRELEKLEDEIAAARAALDDAERRVGDATRERDKLAKTLEALEARRRTQPRH
jgi:hypothetical protein